MADVYAWSATRPDGTGPTGACLQQATAISALAQALREIEPGIEGIVQAADIEMHGRDARYRYHDEPIARAHRDASTGIVVWDKTPEPAQ